MVAGGRSWVDGAAAHAAVGFVVGLFEAVALNVVEVLGTPGVSVPVWEDFGIVLVNEGGHSKFFLK